MSEGRRGISRREALVSMAVLAASGCDIIKQFPDIEGELLRKPVPGLGREDNNVDDVVSATPDGVGSDTDERDVVEKKEISTRGYLEIELMERIKDLPREVQDVIKFEWARVTSQETRKVYESKFKKFNKEAELMGYLSYLIENEEYRIKVQIACKQVAEKYNIPLQIIYGIVAAESGGNPFARSDVKPSARGILQLVPGTARAVGLKVDKDVEEETDKDKFDSKVDERFDVEKCIDAGIKYLGKLRDRFGDLGLALVAYSGGPTNTEDKISLNHDEIEHEDSGYDRFERQQDDLGKKFQKFTDLGRKTYKKEVRQGLLNAGIFYSTSFDGGGLDHSGQYPFWIQELGIQMSEILDGSGEPLSIRRRIVDKELVFKKTQSSTKIKRDRLSERQADKYKEYTRESVAEQLTQN
ncbi:MAG TPA: hypothetical protein DEB09_01600 [Candidatus Magasanikbacteria bacterium]|nr:hypothetical protein [Candidatus Magasanikbacteria bacterium]